MKLRVRGHVPPLPELALVAAIVITLAGITGVGANVAVIVSPWLPIDPASIDPLDAATAIITLAALAIAIRRRKRLALPMAVLLFFGAAVSQALVLHHPVGAAVALACLGALIRDARRFRTRSGRRTRQTAAIVMVAAMLVLILGSALESVAPLATVGSPINVLGGAIVDVLSFGDPGATIGTGSFLTNALELVAELAILVAALAVLTADPDRPPPTDLLRNRALAGRYAQGSLAPFQIGPDKLLFADLHSPGVVAYGLAGRHAVVVGDPIGPDVGAWAAFEAFGARCADGDVAVSVYQASLAGAAHLERAGYRVFRVGSEAIIDLATFGLHGPRRSNLRHTVARAARSGLDVRWHPDGLRLRELDRWSEDLEGIDRDWRGTRGPTMRFTIGTFRLADLARVGTAVALEPDGRVAAFVTFRRIGPTGWVLDVSRRRTDAPPGALEMCIAHAASAMQAAGDVELSLGLVALVDMSASRGSIEERVQAIGRLVVASRYNIDGLQFFKGKFDPRWVPRFGAVKGRFGFVGFAIALLRLHLGIAVGGPTAPNTDHSSAGDMPRFPAHPAPEI